MKRVQCKKCKGTGFIKYEKRVCSVCDGCKCMCSMWDLCDVCDGDGEVNGDEKACE